MNERTRLLSPLRALFNHHNKSPGCRCKCAISRTRSLVAKKFSLPRSSYYDKNYKQSAALIRARQPFLVKNIATGAAIFAFTISVCTSTILDTE
jgi:hypothetical protein